MQSAGAAGAEWGGAVFGMGETGSPQVATKGSNAMEHRNLVTTWLRSGRGPQVCGYLVFAGDGLAAAGLAAAAAGLAVPSPFGSTRK